MAKLTLRVTGIQVPAEAFTQNAIKAINEGKADRTAGGNAPLKVGDVLTIKGYDFPPFYVPKDGMTQAEFDALSEAERAEKGELRQFWAMTTEEGRNISLNSLLADVSEIDDDEWEGDLTDTIEFKIRNIEKFFKDNQSKELIGMKIEIAAKAITLNRRGQEVKHFRIKKVG